MNSNDSFNIEDSKIVRKRILEIFRPYSLDAPFMVTSLMAIIAEICEHLEISVEDFQGMLEEVGEKYAEVINKE